MLYALNFGLGHCIYFTRVYTSHVLSTGISYFGVAFPLYIRRVSYSRGNTVVVMISRSSEHSINYFWWLQPKSMLKITIISLVYKHQY